MRAHKTVDVRSAAFSECRTYRYELRRQWTDDLDTYPMMAFVGLNPSTADEVADDPTVRRCSHFAHHWGYGGMHMLNIFAFRATDPKVMKSHPEPVGVDNDAWIAHVVESCELTVACWGVHGAHLERGSTVAKWLRTRAHRLLVFGLTKHGHPKHPLYLPNSQPTQPWPEMCR